MDQPPQRESLLSKLANKIAECIIGSVMTYEDLRGRAGHAHDIDHEPYYAPVSPIPPDFLIESSHTTSNKETEKKEITLLKIINKFLLFLA